MKLKILIFLILTAKLASAQSEWTFKTESEGIKIYSDTKSGLKVKPIKAECIFNATPMQLAAVLLDIRNYANWIYKTKQTLLVKQVSPTELYYYTELNMPWPAENRDLTAHVTVTQNPETKVITVDAPSVVGLVPEKKGITRVNKSNGKWVLTPIGNNQVHVTYYLQIEPDGGAPVWLINLFITDGPMQSLKKLRLQVQKTMYQNASLPFVK